MIFASIVKTRFITKINLLKLKFIKINFIIYYFCIELFVNNGGCSARKNFLNIYQSSEARLIFLVN